MEPLHDLYCDESHTPRQACNDALAPAEAHARRQAEPEPIEPQSSPAEEEPPMSSAVREAIAIAEMAPPTRYVTREWERTVASVTGMTDADIEPEREQGSRRGGIVAWIAIAGVALAAVALFVRALRGRSGDPA